MREAFRDYIREHTLFNPEDQILLAISGGIDSMVMADLFLKENIPVAAAHCNFLLRGKESDDDESFVEAFCLERGLKMHVERFETEKHARDRGISIQMAARHLRYSWFEEIRRSFEYQYVALAHNLDDVIETFFINLSRGTGVRGLTGIKPKTGKIIRPLLFATREVILSYCNEQQIRFREDSSNKTVKYSRNRIRHHVIPEFLTINPSFRKNMLETISNLNDVDQVYREAVEHRKSEVVQEIQEKVLINISALKTLQPAATYLYEFIRPYHFPKQIVADIMACLDGTAGKQFFSPTHRLLKDREELIITELPDHERELFYIEEDVIHISQPIPVSFTKSDVPDKLQFPTDKRIACIDLDRVNFPLILRKWRKGDYFQPLGMTDIKKVSDFFVDNKFSIHDKENTWILTSGNKIIWIMGHRIDERFKITGQSTRMLVVELL